MDLEQIKQLMTTVEKSKLMKFTLKKGDFELHLEKGAPSAPLPVPPPAKTIIAEHAFQPEAPKPSHPSKANQEGLFVTSPMVGTFYTASSPEQAPFVKVGDKVTEQTVVCIVEAMKVMNEVKAGVSGVIAEILAINAQPVEFGSKLFRIR